MDDLTWNCEACGRLRDNKDISVLTYSIQEYEKFGPGTVQRNFKYCNDSEKCHEFAKSKAKTGKI